jgi:energy-coupling factor transport system ATP-binding protein
MDGVPIPEGILTIEELVDALVRVNEGKTVRTPQIDDED